MTGQQAFGVVEEFMLNFRKTVAKIMIRHIKKHLMCLIIIYLDNICLLKRPLEDDENLV
jgi:hypothetical protein